ncbi:tubulin-like doman-containing protein [Baaleninema sp.]|uniref:tubulin-like doman-containing protein n=1 Tax=Baaleninema sp. TaxID=3101197 RepID=UPI003CFE961F
MAGVVDEKSMVPTVLIGIGGTGHEILSRVRRLVEETYGSLDKFPIVSFLAIDTDKDYKVTNPEAAGTPFKDNEKYWARVSGKQVREIISNMDNYPWINSWFPSELERNISSLEAGAGQIRACGRFAFFCNYYDIQQRFRDACNRIKGHENFMLDTYGIKVSTNAVNVFLTGSLSGGTGSGMIIDTGYCVRHWLKGEGSALVTAIVPMPNAFAGINVGDRVLANGYAAMMELSYFSDHRTLYASQFSSSASGEIRSQLPPFDFTYLVGTKNGETEFRLDAIRETIAQNIFLDLTSDFAPHKRSIRDNIKSAWATTDPGGRGYPKNFMSFGLSTVEIPISQIRASLSHRLAKDVVNWWLNDEAILPAAMLDLVRGDLLKKMRLTEGELLTDLMLAKDESYLNVVSKWVNGLRNEITSDNLLQCTQQGVKMIGREEGKILNFVDGYIKPKVDEYLTDHFRSQSPNERLHGDYIKKMYSNRDDLIKHGRQALEEEFYRIVEDRTRGPKFANDFIVTVRQVFDDAIERFKREREQVWERREKGLQDQYEYGLQQINEFKDKFGITKQSQMQEYGEMVLSGLEGVLMSIVQKTARSTGLQVLERLQEHLTVLERRLNRFTQRLVQLRDTFDRKAKADADSADSLEINGIKLFDRQELNALYQDFLEQLAGSADGALSQKELGLDRICGTISEDVLKIASPLWKENRDVEEYMRLFDVTEVEEVRLEDFQEIVYQEAKGVVEKAPANSKIKRELAACDRLFKAYKDDATIENQMRIAYNKSKPLILLDKAVLDGKDAQFKPATNQKVALIGGKNTSNAAAQKLIPRMQQFIGSDDSITPLGENERHRIVFVQETGGFSLRCIDGMKDLRHSYQDWKGSTIEAKRAQLRGESRELPIPVHIQKEAPFWDIFPENPAIFKIVLLARILGVLRIEQNQKTKENVIRYTRSTPTGDENIDIAATWEEAVQVLEVAACRRDREAIEEQVNAILNSAENADEKMALYQQFLDYLDKRSLELEGGKDSPEYKREDTIIKGIIETYKLQPHQPPKPQPKPQPTPQVQAPPEPQPFVEETPPPTPVTPAENSTANSTVFCTNCGTKNPANSKFCFNCGTKLVQ